VLTAPGEPVTGGLANLGGGIGAHAPEIIKGGTMRDGEGVESGRRPRAQDAGGAVSEPFNGGACPGIPLGIPPQAQDAIRGSTRRS
jgi:hypothetical protein